jgi:hypothetical protein
MIPQSYAMALLNYRRILPGAQMGAVHCKLQG